MHLVKACIDDLGDDGGFVVACALKTLIDLSTLETCLEDDIRLLKEAVSRAMDLQDELGAEPSCAPER